MRLPRLISRLLGRSASQESAAPPLPEGELRDYARSELASFDGSDPSRPLLIAVRGEVYDVTRGRSFYGAGGPYGMFAGKDCTRALAKLSFEPEDFTSDVDGLSEEELEKLEEWIEMFTDKYRRLGRLLED